MIKAYKFRIYPSKRQQVLLTKTFGCVRYIWNYFLDRKEKAFENHESLSLSAMSKELTDLKKQIDCLREPDKCALQNTIIHLSHSYNKFFKIQQSGSKYTPKKLQQLAKSNRKPTRMDLNGHPQFKRLRDNKKSYKTSCNIAVLEKHIKLPKLGKIRYRDKRHSVEGRILSATISQEPSGKYYVSICCTDVPEKPVYYTRDCIGIDLGIKDFLITPIGEDIPNPKFLQSRLKKLKRLQKALSRKTKDGSNWNKNKLQLAITHERIRHTRLDFHHKITTMLANNYDIVCLETLKIKNMTKNHKLAQAILNVAWGQFVEILMYKMSWNRKRLIRIATYFPSSQTCSRCGYKNSETKNLSVREWVCPRCGAHHNRDVNAAINILHEGLKLS